MGWIEIVRVQSGSSWEFRRCLIAFKVPEHNSLIDVGYPGATYLGDVVHSHPNTCKSRQI